MSEPTVPTPPSETPQFHFHRNCDHCAHNMIVKNWWLKANRMELARKWLRANYKWLDDTTIPVTDIEKKFDWLIREMLGEQK